MPRIAGFDDDVQIVHIGELFRARSKRDWYINVWCRPLQDKKSTRISNLALLSRSKRINSSKRGENSADRVIEFPSRYCVFRDDPASDFGMSRPSISVSSGHLFRYRPASLFFLRFTVFGITVF